MLYFRNWTILRKNEKKTVRTKVVQYGKPLQKNKKLLQWLFKFKNTFCYSVHHIWCFLKKYKIQKSEKKREKKRNKKDIIEYT